MAQLRGLGQPFGSPGGIVNIPAPAGSALAGQIQMQAMQGIGQALGQYLAGKRQQEAWQQDQRNMQVAQQAAAQTGMGQIPGWGMPQMQSRMGQQAQTQSQLGQMFADPLEREYKQAQINRLNRPTKGRSYQTSWYDANGKKRSAIVPEEIYSDFQAQIENKGGTLKEPDSLEDQYRWWQDRLQKSRGTDAATTMSRAMAKLSNIDVPITRDIEGETLAMNKLKELQKKLRGGRKAGQPVNPYKKDYPNAFFERGVWKVRKNGLTFRIEED